MVPAQQGPGPSGSEENSKLYIVECDLEMLQNIK